MPPDAEIIHTLHSASKRLEDTLQFFLEITPPPRITAAFHEHNQVLQDFDDEISKHVETLIFAIAILDTIPGLLTRIGNSSAAIFHGPQQRNQLPLGPMPSL